MIKKLLLTILVAALTVGNIEAGTNFIKGTQSTDSQTVTGTVTCSQATASNLKVDLSGTAANSTAVKVDGSAVTQPVSFSAGNTVVIQRLDGGGAAGSVGWTGIAGSSVPVSITGFPTSSAPTITKVGATTTSAQLIAASATRKGIEIDTDCANTDSVAINFGAGAAVYANHKIIPACVNWQPPPGVTLTSAIQVISNSGTQQVRVVEYP